ncbi:tetratricopeptide repeat protein [Actinoplanes sp. Pm04-4]|uniref:Tetratricopeptide repeat protein n=1 Tax=Paractinoplanes pyxinae TaxID=2997416 RepID=A0ABT4B4Y5_9ACTN|nr:tetratricopeptide repeat protein [Actinoplanes pyxinae]MCY1141559.1 tetratricopeptide repeat protein [Actinoplanes pyxinae]
MTLSNIGLVHNGRGDRRQGLAYFEQALPIMREVGDRAGEQPPYTTSRRSTGLRAGWIRRSLNWNASSTSTVKSAIPILSPTRPCSNDYAGNGQSRKTDCVSRTP